MAFTKILVSINEGKIQSEINTLEIPKAYFQDFVNKLIAIGIQPKENDLKALFETPKAYITDKLTDGKTLEVAGLSINKDKLFELIEKPTGTDELIQQIETDITDRIKNEFYIWKVSNFTIIENKVHISAEFTETIKNRFSVFIENENQKTAFEKLKNIAKLVNELNQLEGKKIKIDTELEEILKLENGNFEPNEKALKSMFF